MGLQGRICDVEGICVAVLVYAVDIWQASGLGCGYMHMLSEAFYLSYS